NIEDNRRITRIDNNIIDKIIELCKERVTYGYNRIWALLRNSGINIAKKTVYKIMKNNNLTLPLHNHKNRRELKLLKADRPEMLIETDITYIPTNNGMTYLMCIKDAFSKEWYGYNYNTSCTARDAINAIDDAIIRKFNGIIPDNITLRTDNGPQYISKEFNNYLKIMGINHEYIEKETPEENGDIESFHNSIKTDYIWINEINNFSDGKIIIERAFYDYNNIRPHSTLDYYSPLQFLDKWNNDSTFREYYRGFLKNLKDGYRRRNSNYYKRSMINVS
ncbi:IS3 family transposase, partial [Acidiplasma sp.]|uniref:IS3 family transposase n=1 Tax=Acidiplasma sp. TaxID=1872114 RepID=UPI002588D167